MKKLYRLCLMTAVVFGLASCGEKDDFTESIFDTSVETIDSTAATAPFDQWLYENFVLPYNTEIQYKFNFPASNLSFQLAPAAYDKSQQLAHFIKYLFYDVYSLYGGQDFMKRYGPRMFHFIGSSAYSPTTGTETLGYASAGVKITLINVNNMRMWSAAQPFTPATMDSLNKDQFHTMHHEFSHILHQTKSYPVTFGQVTPGSYEPRDWQERDSVESHRLGFVTQYGSSATYEDFVETLSCTITDTDYRWMTTIIDACANGGMREGDKERIMTLIDSLEIGDFDNPAKVWNKFTIYKESSRPEGATAFEETGRFVPDFHQADTQSHAETSLKFDKVQDFTSFADFMAWAEAQPKSEGTDGINALLKKLEIATKWYTEEWGLHLYEIRREVRKRQNEINDYVKDNVTIYELQ